jgi:hypothetical protein
MGDIVAALLLRHDDFKVEFMSIKMENAGAAVIAAALRSFWGSRPSRDLLLYALLSENESRWRCFVVKKPYKHSHRCTDRGQSVEPAPRAPAFSTASRTTTQLRSCLRDQLGEEQRILQHKAETEGFAMRKHAGCTVNGGFSQSTRTSGVFATVSSEFTSHVILS